MPPFNPGERHVGRSSSIGKPSEKRLASCNPLPEEAPHAYTSSIRISSLFSSSTFSMFQRSLDPGTISEILEYPGEYSDEAEKAKCRRMVEELTPAEQEVIAGTSHAYWLHSRTNNNTPSDELRITTAMKEARRHALSRSYERGMDSLRKAAHFRQEWKVDLLRLCFNNELGDFMENLNEEDRAFVVETEKALKKELKRAPMCIRGYDKKQRIFLHRQCPKYRASKDKDLEVYLAALIFMVEKAMACSEALSKGRESMFNIVMDYNGHSSKHGTPISMSQAAAVLLRKNYPNRVHRIFVLDVPMIVRTFYALLSPFLSKQTKEKMRFVNGDAQKRKSLGCLVDPEQATSAMLPEGKLSTQIDVDRSLDELPFHALYDK